MHVIAAAQALPSPGWLDRLQSEPQAQFEAAEATELSLEVNPSEAFLQALHQQLRARMQLHPRHDQLECDLQPVDARLDLLAARLREALCALKKPLERLAGAFMAQLSDPDDILEAPQRIRLEAAARALKRRAIFRLDAWIDLLTAIAPEKALRMMIVSSISSALRPSLIAVSAAPATILAFTVIGATPPSLMPPSCRPRRTVSS